MLFFRLCGNEKKYMLKKIDTYIYFMSIFFTVYVFDNRPSVGRQKGDLRQTNLKKKYSPFTPLTLPFYSPVQ